MLNSSATGPILFPDQMPNGGDGVLRQHSRSGVAHDLANALSHLGLIAVILTGVAAGLHVHLAAPTRSQGRVSVKLGAAGAHRFAAHCLRIAWRVGMVSGAVQRDHLRNRALLAHPALRYLR